MKLSIVIPLLNEEESLEELYHWIVSVMQSNDFVYELIFIDDGSTDSSWQVIEEIAARDPSVKGIRFLKNFGKSQALHAGFKAAGGDVVITMDADLQDNPEEIPAMVSSITEEGYDMVSGWKKKRYDPFLSKNLPSKLFNWAARRISGIKLHDFNCGLKAYRQSVIRGNAPVYPRSGKKCRVFKNRGAGCTPPGQKIRENQIRGRTLYQWLP